MSVYDADVAVGVPMPRPKSNFGTKIPNTATMVALPIGGVATHWEVSEIECG